ncbi:gluconokinase [Robiginitalea myxolifaciens]|uniref:Gluconokinase n=1 Tax=Robiginitalea myxolifaciens TaxID=400055 RepID=A0A1I6GSG2_9FLAO|nr:gluconokinase [Robiginitalea myxolifaciens]SFR45142.1 gluconokinase [Robiginitalea myxolifaciens]
MNSKIYWVMGVSACGKSTLGKALAARFGIPFFDGDDYHPEANIEKMAAGIPLEDADRLGWLERLNALAQEHGKQKGAVIACSALKESYRQLLSRNQTTKQVWVVLLGSYEQLLKRIQSREDHFMPPALLQSQFDTLEIPVYGLHLDCTQPLDILVKKIPGPAGE